MVFCKICGKEFKRIIATHLASHGLTMQEYKEKYPDAKIVTNPKRKVKGKEKTTSPENQVAGVPIYENETRVTLMAKVPTAQRFKEYRETWGWTIPEAINTLIDHDIEYNKILSEKEEEEKLKRLAGEELPSNFTTFHRDQLQKLLKILEEKAYREEDTTKLANITDKIAKINQILPTLDKSYESEIDQKIEEIISKRKAICYNYLPEDDAYPWSNLEIKK